MVALTSDQHLAIERRVSALERKEPLDLDVVAVAIGRVPQPELLVRHLGGAIQYAQRVEADVAGLSISTLLPHEATDHVGRFLAVWVPDETGHGVAQQVLLDHLGLPVTTAASPDAVPVHNRIAGVLGRLSRHAHTMVSMTYHTIGAMNERLAIGAYTKIARVARTLGATELADVLYAPMRTDESLHLGYYRTYAAQLRHVLARWQLAAVRALIVHTWAPVGAGGRDDKGPFGEVLLALEEDPENPSIAAVVQDIAEDLLAEPDATLSPFVRRQLVKCVNLATAGS